MGTFIALTLFLILLIHCLYVPLSLYDSAVVYSAILHVYIFGEYLVHVDPVFELFAVLYLISVADVAIVRPIY